MSMRTGAEPAGEEGTRAVAGPALGISTLGDLWRGVTSHSTWEGVPSLGRWSGKARAHEGRPDKCV